MNKVRNNIILFAFLVTLSLPASAQVSTLRGKVVSIADGDTITILDDTNRQYRIRLQGIDAPESSQSFGNASTENLARLVFNKFVNVEWSKHDRYGRIVGNVFIYSQDVGLQQVKAGLAWHYKEYENEQSANDRRLYAEAEVEARAKKLGLWADLDPIPPWRFRHGGAPAHNSTTVVSKPVIPKTSNGGDGVYLRGPRGGCYTYVRGRKIYVDHALCN